MKILNSRLAQSHIVLILSLWASKSMAAEAVAISPSGGILKIVLGLAIVLVVMALLTWFLKRMMPGVGNKQSVVRIVGSVSVGSRERVVVLEIAGRWIVVGVAPGQVNRIANLEMGAAQLAESGLSENGVFNQSSLNQKPSIFTEMLAQWLSKSAPKIQDRKLDKD